MKKNRFDFQEMKETQEKIVFLTSYDFPMARFAEKAGVDMSLVGDSLGMCVYGYSGTVPITMEQCISHCRAVRRGAPDTFVIGDMPFLSYQESVENAIHNVGRFHKEAEVDAVKLEGGRKVTDKVRGIVDAGMLVMGHIGLTPQSSGQLGGFKAQGRTAESAMALVADALALEQSGAFALLLEAIPPEVAEIIGEKTRIPCVGIGAGPACDGQLLIVSDMLGIFEAFTPKFVKKYANLADTIAAAMRDYVCEVQGQIFPTPEHTYRMIDGELEKFNKLVQ
jgi:3-methyl-2-oxobutanoate hydroxymethyltransferase